MTTAVETIRRIKRAAEEIRSENLQHFPQAASSGDTVRQGDIYITFLDKIPDNVKKIKCMAQLAPGSNKGSRHMLDSLKGVKMYEKLNGTPLDGPLIELEEPRIVTHPEHGDWSLPTGCYGITYQRAYTEELKRALD